MINKNDCFDCANCIPKDLFSKKSEWVCKITKEAISNDGIKDEECIDFEYEE